MKVLPGSEAGASNAVHYLQSLTLNSRNDLQGSLSHATATNDLGGRAHSARKQPRHSGAVTASESVPQLGTGSQVFLSNQSRCGPYQ